MKFHIVSPQFSRFVEAQKRSSKQNMERLREVTHSHSEALHRLEEQEKKHQAFIHQSNCLTMILEQDRERFVRFR